MSVANEMACNDTLVTALLEVLMHGARLGHLEQSERLLAALRVLRPNFIELGAYDGWMLIRRSRYSEAVRVLRELEHQPLRGTFAPYVRALIAVSLYGMEDPQWHVYAHDVVSGNEDPDSVELVATLLGLQTEHQARETAAPLAVTREAARVPGGVMDHRLQRHHLRA
ncbi:HrpB1 family type III secretion system apparatus protein [Paraburkholderia hayleyella]|uniref:HrpB1 family type III secretion system apparatus protein n=1 Tax=Paraburkholderia hayleyella TaxID=2152889 RepID=UPI0012912800|nr:HrpB1 family type III secretion system apparatus protein [Paraburkholderia hayleyella]